MLELKLKPDFARTAARFEAWWRCDVIDRPPVTLHVQPTRPYRGPTREHASASQRWLDMQFQVERGIALLEQRDFLADALPVIYPNLGPEITAAMFGAQIDYIDERTGWTEPVVREPADWQRIIDTRPDFNNPWWRAMELGTKLAIQANGGRYLVGMTDLHGNYDILAALRDPQTLCLDLVDYPELVLRAGRHVAGAYVQAFDRCYAAVAAAGFGSTTWTPFYHDGPAYLPSCDFWCMMSPQSGREMVLPDILTEMRPLARSLFHLDGPNALGHLDALLERPELTGVQWVYGAGNGPASRWIDVYRRIQQAGKCMQVTTADGDDALRVLEAIGPRGVWLVIGQQFATAKEAQAFLRQVEKMRRA